MLTKKEDAFVTFLIEHNIFDAYMFNIMGVPNESFHAFIWGMSNEDREFWYDMNAAWFKTLEALEN